MFIISRFEQFVQYWWTGVRWAANKDQAKRFDTRAQAEAETARFSYTCTIVAA